MTGTTLGRSLLVAGFFMTVFTLFVSGSLHIRNFAMFFLFMTGVTFLRLTLTLKLVVTGLTVINLDGLDMKLMTEIYRTLFGTLHGHIASRRRRATKSNCRYSQKSYHGH